MAERARTAKDAPRKNSANRATDLERIIAHLDTLYERGDDCIHPDTGIAVTDGEYDAMRRDLIAVRPESKVFRTATASELKSQVRKVVHDPPMTSIEKASHEDVQVQEEMLFKWLSDRTSQAPAEVRDGKHELLKGKTYNGENVDYPKDYFYHAYKLDGVAIAI